MRGSPLARAALAFFILLSLAYPLWQMTKAGEGPPAPGAARTTPSIGSINLHLSLSRPAEKISIWHSGTEIWSAAHPAEEFEQKLQLPYPKEGVDLRFKIEWPNSALGALRVQLTDPAGEEHEKSIWAKGAADEVLTFP